MTRLGRILRILLVALVVLLVAHDADHVVNEERLGELPAAFWLFLPIQYGAYLGVLILLARRHPLAAAASGALAATAIVAFAGAHLAPFGLLPYSEADPGLVSWLLVFAPMAVAALALATAIRMVSDARGEARPG